MMIRYLVEIMNRPNIVAIITGAISILLAIVYLIIVQLLDFRGEMKPAPIGQIYQYEIVVAYNPSTIDNFTRVYKHPEF
jgi:hypothetical protein